MYENEIASNWIKKRLNLAQDAHQLPDSAGVYMMLDSTRETLYIGKARSLKKRVGSYFVESADLGPWKQSMLPLIDQIEIIECETEWEALLLESRLIKDHRPKYNSLSLDDKTFPYLVVTTKDDFPGVYITRTPNEPKYKRAKVFGPFTSAGALNQSINMLQTVFKYRTCDIQIDADDKKNTFFRPCLLHAIDRCSAPCAAKIDKNVYKKSIDQFMRFISSKRSVMLRELSHQMEEASTQKRFEEAAIIRDQIQSIEKLDERASSQVVWQSEVTVFFQDPSVGMKSLRKALGVDADLRFIEGFDIAHLQGNETVAAKVSFMDGRPFKDGYRRYKIRTSANDDYMSIREVISRRYKEAGKGFELYPDLILIDGGKGQLSAAMDVFDSLQKKPPHVVSLAKKEELIYTTIQSEPIRLGRNNEGLKLLQAIRDEAHRFAQHYHHFLRSKNMFEKS